MPTLLPFARPTRYVALVAVCAAIGAPVLHAQSALTGYSPFAARYRIAGTTHTSQVMMGQTQETDATSDEIASVVVAKSGAGLSLKMTLDSIAATASAPLPTPDVTAAIGLTLTATMDLDGHVGTSDVADKAGKPSDSPIAAGMRSFLPRLKVGASKGATWADTTTTSRKQNGADVTTSVITIYTLAGDTTLAKGKAWKLLLNSTGTINGTGNQQGADFTLKGTMTGQGAVILGANGLLESYDQLSNVNMVADVPMAGMQIPITQKQTTKIARLP